MPALNDVAAGLALDPRNTPIVSKYPTASEVNKVFQDIYKYGAVELLNSVKSMKELCDECPDIKHLNIPAKMFPYLKASIYIEGVPAELIVAIENILNKCNCGSMVVHGLPDSIVKKLCTFGYLNNGITLNSILEAMLGKFTPSTVPGRFTMRTSGVEYCVAEGTVVYIAGEVLNDYMISDWHIENGKLYLKRGVPYEYKRHGVSRV